MNKLPIVAIVGRANVGKSSLFNRIVDAPRAVVAREAGTTRDAITEVIEYNEQAFWLVDTAGLKNPEDDFEATIQEQIQEAVASSDMIMVVTEANAGINEEDRKVAKQALKSKKPVMLVLNKSDQTKEIDFDAFRKLGIREIVTTSAAQNRNVDELLEKLVKHIPKKAPPKQDKALTITLVGRPNVGKSHLFNTLAKKQQAVVADVAGTTRDINKVTVKYHDQDIEIIDTAGIRRSGKIQVGIEKFSVLRTLWAIQHADVCLMLMDANEYNTSLDQKIAGMIKDAGKGMVIVISKWDSIEKDAYTRDQMASQISREFPFAAWASLIFTSSVTGQNVSKLFDVALGIQSTRRNEISTSAINKFLAKTKSKHPPAGLKNSHPKLRYMTQTGTEPPEFTIFGTDMHLLHWSWKRFMEKEMRYQFGYEGTPIKFEYINNREDE